MIQVPSTRLYWRIALYIGAALAAFVAIAVVGLFVVASQELANYTATRHGTLGREAAAVLERRGVEGLRDWLQREADVPPDVTIYILDPAGRDVLGRPLPELYARFVQRSVVGDPRAQSGNYRPVRLAPRLVAPDGREYAFLPLPNRIGILGNRATTFGLLAAAMLVIGTVAWLIARALARPLGELQRTVRAFASGQTGARVPAALAARRDELGALASDFNAMAERIASLLEHRRRLMGELSHELRSPLARLRASLALADHRGSVEPADRARIDQEVGRMDRLIGDMLRYSRLEAAPEPALRLLRVETLLGELVRDEDVEAQARGCTLRLAAAEPCRVVADPELLRSGIENVLRNAIRHSPPGSEVTIESGRDREQARIAVLDRGPGVPEPSLERIFEPFVRAGAPDDGGTGLGLAIARRVFEAHGGAIRAAARPGGGLCVTMTLPLAELS